MGEIFPGWKFMMSKKKKGCMPRLRFPEFRDMGEWKVKRLGEVAEIFKGKNIAKSDVCHRGKTFCIRYGELYTYYQEIIITIKSKTNLSSEETFLSLQNDVLIPSSGETKEDIAKASCVLLDGVALGGDINVIRSTQNGIFLSYFFNSSQKRNIAKIAQGNSVVHLYPNQLKQLNIYTPSLPEQQKIANCLSSLDKVINLETEKLETLKSHKKGLMQQLFPREGETTPRLRFPEFRDKGKWESVRLGDVCNFSDGYAFSSNDFLDFSENLIQVVRITDINNRNKNEDKVYISIQLAIELGIYKNLIKKGDLLLSLTGAAGFNFYIWNSEKKALLNQRTLKITPKEENSQLVKLIEALTHKQINEQGSGQNNNLSKETLKNIKIIIPSYPEQQKIANCLSSLYKIIDWQTQKLDTLKSHKKGLMQQLFPQEV